jgi:hypothetical protein
MSTPRRCKIVFVSNLFRLLLRSVPSASVSQRSGYFLIVRATRSERSDEIHPNGIYLRLGLRDSNVTSIDTLPTEEFLDQIHIHGMRLASAHQPPRFRVLKPSALLGIGIAAQQFILQRLKPLLQDHIASQRPRDAPPEFYDDIDDEEQDIGDHIEVESGHSDDQPSTQLPESSNDLLLELPKDIRGRASESGLHETTFQRVQKLSMVTFQIKKFHRLTKQESARSASWWSQRRPLKDRNARKNRRSRRSRLNCPKNAK